MKKYYYIIILIITAILVISSINLEYGHPENLDFVNYYFEHGIQDTGAINLVASVYLDYRAYDTLMETIVLFMAVIAVLFFLGKGE